MIEYGAIINNSFSEQLRISWNDFLLFLGDVPVYWYILAAVILAVLIKLLVKS